MKTLELTNRFSDFIMVDLEFLDGGYLKLYYNEVQQGAVFNHKTEVGKQKFRSFIEKSFLYEDVEQIMDLLN